jgi:hypothetical protein
MLLLKVTSNRLFSRLQPGECLRGRHDAHRGAEAARIVADVVRGDDAGAGRERGLNENNVVWIWQAASPCQGFHADAFFNDFINGDGGDGWIYAEFRPGGDFAVFCYDLRRDNGN